MSHKGRAQVSKTYGKVDRGYQSCVYLEEYIGNGSYFLKIFECQFETGEIDSKRGPRPATSEDARSHQDTETS